MPPATQAFHPNNDPDVMIVENDSDVAAPDVFKPPILDDSDVEVMEVGNNIGQSPAKRRDVSSNSSHMENNLAIASTSSGPSGASTGPKILNFNIKYCDKVVKMRLPDTASLSKLMVDLLFVD